MFTETAISSGNEPSPEQNALLLKKCKHSTESNVVSACDGIVGETTLLTIDAEPVKRARVINRTTIGSLSKAVAQPPRHYPVLKRIFDLVVATGALVLLSPVCAVIALAIKISSPGPVIFRQKRLTQGGREFIIYKFRTMRHLAERECGPVFAARRDPRITVLGRSLRTSRLDEIPQLWNVIQGDMSIIGPRPERPELVSMLQEKLPSFDRRMRTKAGITGLAQVKYEYPDGIEGYRRKLAFDLLYIRRQSIRLDLWIAVRTVGLILSGGGGR